MYKQDLALNNLQWLICHKTQPIQTKPNLTKHEDIIWWEESLQNTFMCTLILFTSLTTSSFPRLHSGKALLSIDGKICAPHFSHINASLCQGISVQSLTCISSWLIEWMNLTACQSVYAYFYPWDKGTVHIVHVYILSWPTDITMIGTMTPDQSEPGNSGYRGMLYSLHSHPSATELDSHHQM